MRFKKFRYEKEDNNPVLMEILDATEFIKETTKILPPSIRQQTIA